MSTNFNHMLTLSEIIRNKQPAVAIQGLYFLLQSDDVVYIGQSEDILGRVRFHAKNKRFDSFSVFECSKGNLNNLEAKHIVWFNPFYNGTLPENDKFKGIEGFLKAMNISLWQRKKLKNFIKENKIKPVYQVAHSSFYDVNDLAIFVRQV